jgi:hypothetical protein
LPQQASNAADYILGFLPEDEGPTPAAACLDVHQPTAAVCFPATIDTRSPSTKNEGIRLRMLNLGAGVQSTALALMAAHGEIGPMPDCTIFADTVDNVGLRRVRRAASG